MTVQIAVPRVPDLFVPILRVLDGLGGSASIEEINDKVAALMGLPDEVRAVQHGDGPMTKFDYRCAWARSWLKNAGFAENSERGVWALTAEGRGMLTVDPDKTVKIVRKANADRRKASVAIGGRAANDELDIDVGETVVKDWREQLLDI